MKILSKKLFHIILFFLIVSIVSCNDNNFNIDKEYFTFGTFNMEWLGDEIKDTKPRTESEIKEIAELLLKSGLEVIAVQEVENENALNRVVKYMNGYKIKLSKQNINQKVGIIYRDYIKLKYVKEYEKLNLSKGLRNGFIVKIEKEIENNKSYQLLMMVVHLKSTSRYDSTEALIEESRETRKKQVNILKHWTDSTMKTENKEIVIIGDFNDFPLRKKEPTLNNLFNSNNLTFLTKDVRSCENSYLYTIDHIVVSETVKQRYVEGSMFVHNFYRAFKKEKADKISDHCPVSVELKIK